MKHYIYRYKADGIEVTPSRCETPEKVWAFAIKWLRPGGLKNDKEAERIVREAGEVVPDDQ